MLSKFRKDCNPQGPIGSHHWPQRPVLASGLSARIVWFLWAVLLWAAKGNSLQFCVWQAIILTTSRLWMIKGSNHCYSLNSFNCWNSSKDPDGGPFSSHSVLYLPRQPYNGLNYHLFRQHTQIDISGWDLLFDLRACGAYFFLKTPWHLKTQFGICLHCVSFPPSHSVPVLPVPRRGRTLSPLH